MATLDYGTLAHRKFMFYVTNSLLYPSLTLLSAALSSKAESDMLKKEIGALEKEVVASECKRTNIDRDYQPISEKLSKAREQLDQMVCTNKMETL